MLDKIMEDPVIALYNDPINNPKHYKIKDGVEVIDVIDSVTKDLVGARACYTSNVIKYICRWPFKGSPLKDLKKAHWYLTRLIDLLESENLKY